MITETVLNFLASTVEVLFSWIQLPAFPAGLTASVDKIMNLMFDNLGLLSFFVRISTIKLLVPVVIVIVNFDKLYKLTMFILRKLPLGIE